MIYNGTLKSGDICLRTVSENDCTQRYLNWLYDEKIIKPLGTTHKNQTIETIKEFVKLMRESNNDYFFAILYENEHIGNIKLGPINWKNKEAEISYFIGKTKYWGKGFATQAVKLVSNFAFLELDINKIHTQIYSSNISSKRVLEKNGFIFQNKSEVYKNMDCYVLKNNH